MAITMIKLCENAKEKYNMELVAGRGGVENTVRWVHMVEDREVPDFLHGGELIFTTGIGHIEDEARMLEFVRNLHRHGAAGVVFNIGPYIHAVPPEVRRFADAHDFPVFTLPWKVHIIDITYDFCNRIIENEKAEISLMQAFRNLIFSPENERDYLPALEKNGFAANAEYRVMVICFYNRAGKAVTSSLYAKNRTLVWKLFASSASPAAILEQGGCLVIVKQNCALPAVRRMLQAMLQALEPGGLRSRTGVSGAGSGYLSVPGLYRQAHAAFTTARQEEADVRFYDEIGMNRLILAVNNKPLLEEYARSVLAPLTDYDQKNHADCTKLLRLYIEADCSVNAAAEQSGVHRNTINNRMKLVRTLLGGELTEKRKAELLLAFRITDLLRLL